MTGAPLIPDGPHEAGDGGGKAGDRPGSARLFGWLWRRYLARHWALLGLAMIMMTLEGSMFGLLSWMMKPIFDRLFAADAGGGGFGWVGLAFLGIFATRAISSVAQKGLLAMVSQRSLAAIRLDMLARLLELDLDFHARHGPGQLMQRIEGDVESVNKVWTTVLTGAGRDAVALVALFSVALAIDWRWTLVALVGAPLLVVPSLVVQAWVRRVAREERVTAGRLSGLLNEILSGIVPIRLNRLEGFELQRFRQLTRRRMRLTVRSQIGSAAVPALIDLMAGLGFMGVLLYGATQILQGDKTVGDFMAFFTALGLAFEPLRRLGSIGGTWQVAAAAIERIRALLETRPSITDPADPLPAPRGVPDVVFDDVTVSYAGQNALNGARFAAPAGQRTALVGPSGAGKTTVFNALTRLVDPVAGTITVGGVDNRRMRLADLRGMVAAVTQDALLFDDTLRANIVLDRTDVSERRLREVLDAAHVSDFLPRLPQGLDTPVGPRGSNLSGGQRQRVVIARALLRDAPILLLDEATSALDSQSEILVQDALNRLSRGRTTLVIAHRLATVRDADRIVVMEAGRVVECGNHDELMALGGLYADLVRLQSPTLAGDRQGAVDGPQSPSEPPRRAE